MRFSPADLFSLSAFEKKVMNVAKHPSEIEAEHLHPWTSQQL